MKIHTIIPKGLNDHFKKWMKEYKTAHNENDLTKACHLLEEAHILAKPFPVQHTKVHWEMLKFRFAIKSPKEILGQLPRLLIGGIKSCVGVIPDGNTGGANVAPLKTMPIPDHLKNIINRYNS